MIHSLRKSPITYLLGYERDLQAMLDSDHLINQPFSEPIKDCLSQLSEYLLLEGQQHADIVAAGFWLRKSQIERIVDEYQGVDLTSRGLSFHIAPGNVDTLFFYSMMTSFLTGNYTVLRINNQVSIVAMQLIDLLKQFIDLNESAQLLKHRLCIIQYDHDDNITSMISKVSDVRVIWGGNRTVDHISSLPKKLNSVEIQFPDRYSVAAIEIVSEEMLVQAVESFFRDVEPFMQQACSSPKVVYWHNTTAELQHRFWQLLSEKLLSSQRLQGTDKLSQLLYLQRLALLITKGEHPRISVQSLNDVKVIADAEVTTKVIDAHPGLYVFISQNIVKLKQLKLLSHCQTVTMFGLANNDWKHWLETTEQPMKRWIPAGRALAFSHHWDGLDLIRSLTQTDDTNTVGSDV